MQSVFLRLRRAALIISMMLLAASTRIEASPPSSIIPRPLSVEPGTGRFTLKTGALIQIDGASVDLSRVARLLHEQIQQKHGLSLAIARRPTEATNGIRLTLGAVSADVGPEGYELTVEPHRATIAAASPTGLIWGTQTLLQMLASAGPAAGSTADAMSLTVVRILDRPRFGWRGLLLDCSRTFIPIDLLKKYVDVCASYKMNVLHLHLTDDQGWRLEIRRHPRLTEFGSRLDPRFPGEISGYYTQEQMRDLIRYAADRGVTIVPEIEMPGHALALLATYPELSCRQGRDTYVIAPYMFQTDRSPDKSPQTPYGVLCVGNEKTYQVLGEIIDEVIELFPGEYFHIGADECSKTWWKACPQCQARIRAEGLEGEDALQSYFVRRIARLVQARGRKVMGWDEVLEGGLAPQIAVMGWRGMPFALDALRQGHPVVMAQKSHLYLDYCYNRTPASLIYAFDPIPPELNPAQYHLILGVEACLWTHLARTEQMMDMSLFPRLLALAEVGWTAADRRDWRDFSARLEEHVPRLQARGIRTLERNPGMSPPSLTAGEDGRLWLVNAEAEIYLQSREAWERFPGRARQVTSGPDGTIWSISTQSAERGYALMRWSEGAWRPLDPPMSAVQIAAAPDGSLWATTDTYAIWRWVEGKWGNVLGLAREVSAGAEGDTWILTGDPAPGGFQLHSAPPGGRWRRVQPLGAGVHIAAGPSRQLWLVRDDGTVWAYADNEWRDRPGRLLQVAVSKDGEVRGLAEAADRGLITLRWTGERWQELGPCP